MKLDNYRQKKIKDTIFAGSEKLSLAELLKKLYGDVKIYTGPSPKNIVIRGGYDQDVYVEEWEDETDEEVITRLLTEQPELMDKIKKIVATL